MAGDLILDTGPLVAVLSDHERSHDACVDVLEGFHGRLVTTEAVVVEAMYLLGRLPRGQAACLQFLVEGFAEVAPTDRRALLRIGELMAKYADVPMDYADATLVVLAEELGVRDIFTLDRRGFTVYRCAKDQTFSIMP